jgi:hypothetical protein
MDSMAEHCLNHWRGERLAVVGESEGGCTGTTDFHSRLRQEFRSTSTVAIPQWDGIHDYLTVWSRKKRRAK